MTATHSPHPAWPVFVVGQQVEANPDTGAFNQGDRYGTVIEVEGTSVTVQMTSGRVRTFHPQRLSLRLNQPRA